MVGRIDERTREALEDLLLAFVTKDVDGIVDVILRICDVPRGFDRRAFHCRCGPVHRRLSFRLSGQYRLERHVAGVDLHNPHVPHHRTANIIMLGKMLALLEGTGRLLDPDFDLWELAQPYYRQIIERRYAPDKLRVVVTRTSIEIGVGSSPPSRARWRICCRKLVRASCRCGCRWAGWTR